MDVFFILSNLIIKYQMQDYLKLLKINKNENKLSPKCSSYVNILMLTPKKITCATAEETGEILERDSEKNK